VSMSGTKSEQGLPVPLPEQHLADFEAPGRIAHWRWRRSRRFARARRDLLSGAAGGLPFSLRVSAQGKPKEQETAEPVVTKGPLAMGHALPLNPAKQFWAISIA
jgi:hypothetical protein